MTRINLLPWREERAKRRRQYFLTFLFAMAGVALAAVWLADRVIDRAIDRQVTRSSHLSKAVTVLDSQIKTIDELREQRLQLVERMKVVQGLQADRSAGALLFDQLARAVPDGVQLREVIVEGDNVGVRGGAESNQDIARFLRGLEASNALQAPRLQHVQADDEGGGSGFQLMVRQRASAEASQ
ncbi:PilN domain-containing protein [Pseudomonas fluorescens]|uniref:PilN domain-containing protein n=1 Tax=Pseudomonas fluorescens TaxID=294 RepID=UPI001BEC1BC6|nr:PilN domain-containing protein [Pseudomonas fluorescens]MBT2370689.1 PilN domain-containing protein [Pseudomonas fluorescens]